MRSVLVTNAVPAQGETFHKVMLRLWEDVEQTPAMPSLESPVLTRPRAGAASPERRRSEGVTPSRVRFAFD